MKCKNLDEERKISFWTLNILFVTLLPILHLLNPVARIKNANYI